MYHVWYMRPMMTPPRKTIDARFFRLPGGREPVRGWLGKLSREDRRLIGQNLMEVEFGWPCGPPLCASLTGYPGLYEVRSSVTAGRIARVYFAVSGSTMVLLHGFTKKARATPAKELVLANRRMKESIRNE